MNTDDIEKADYGIYHEEIRRTKNQQWQMVFYIVSLQAGLITFRALVSDYIADQVCIAPLLRCFSIFFSITIVLVGVLLIIAYGIKLKEYRELTKKIKRDSEPRKRIDKTIEAFMYLVFIISGIGSAFLAITFILCCK